MKHVKHVLALKNNYKKFILSKDRIIGSKLWIILRSKDKFYIKLKISHHYFIAISRKRL